MPFFLWVRFLTAQKLMALHRRHIGAQKRDARRQVSRGRGEFPEASSDRDVLVLRHFEESTNVEAARELGIEPAAASKRYVRALKRLWVVLEEQGLPPGAIDG